MESGLIEPLGLALPRDSYRCANPIQGNLESTYEGEYPKTGAVSPLPGNIALVAQDCLSQPLVPPWCLPGCPNDPFLPPWCIPGASQVVQLVLSCLPGASLVPPRLSK